MPIPATANKIFDLPNELSTRIVKHAKLALAVGDWGYRRHKSSLKEASIENKWEMLADADPYLDLHQKYKNIILIDDLYQSGTTAHFWAALLKQSGVRKVSILCAAKSNRDTDNQ